MTRIDEQTEDVPRRDYWTTLSEYERDGDFRVRQGEEFFPGAKPERFFDEEEDSEKFLTPMKRRTFLKLGGFAALAAALQSCERPAQKIMPYVNKPEEVTYGVSNYYASGTAETGEGLGLLVKTREGRPIKLEGNPDHPLNRGALGARDQASILDLYNPDRLRYPMRVNRSFDGEVGEALDKGRMVAMGTLDQEVGEAIAKGSGKVVYLSRTVSGPANSRLIEEWTGQGERFEHVVYEPLMPATESRALELCFGAEPGSRSAYDFEKADVVVALGGDPLGEPASPVSNTLGFSARRRPDHADGMSRVFAFEPHPTLTGMKADYRYQVRPEELATVGLAIAHELILGGAEFAGGNREELSANAAVRDLLAGFTPERAAGETSVGADEIRRVARALAERPGSGIVYTGGNLAAETSEALSLHIVGNLINHALGNFGETIHAGGSRQGNERAGAVERLIAEMNDGAVDVLILNDVNPVYTMPLPLGFVAAMEKVKTIVSLDRFMTETAARADLSIPSVHGLECWSDSEPVAGVYTINQPVIRRIYGELAKKPGYDTRPWQDSLIAFSVAAGDTAFMREPSEAEIQSMMDAAGVEDKAELDAEQLAAKPVSFYELMRETYREMPGNPGDFEDFWGTLLQRGFLEVEAKAEPAADFQTSAIELIERPRRVPGLSLALYTSPYHGDGSSMVNPHLLELPDPASKITWENYAAIAPSMAEELGVKQGEHVTVSAGGKSVEIPVHIQPGTHPEVVAVMLGWGRNTFGGVGDGLGVNAYPLAGARIDKTAYFSGISSAIAKARGKTKLADTQGHNYLYSPSYAGVMVNKQHGDIPENTQKNEQGKPVYDRPVVGETTLSEWKANPHAGYPNHTNPGEKPETMWERTHKYEGHHWGMSVDLNACTGCNACVVACSVENNVPVVGKEEVLAGREMHWIRIDRYYRGDKNAPDFVNMPVMCQHCDNAPCETVCPVIATMHNDEGLNVMTYNRCVGTRYCSNNCPYKVRRFNFWQYSDYRTGPQDGRKRVSPLELVLNPDITTRSRGVMEKCTFCVGRIRQAKDEARDAGRPLRDGEMQTACQQTCPARAIHFGDRNDREAEVAADWKNPRAYGLLEDLNTDPSVRYMTMVRNREEPSPYRTKYQAHRMHEEHAGDGHEEPEHE